MQFKFIKNGKPTNYDKSHWLQIVNSNNESKTATPRIKKINKRELTNLASERQSKHPDMGKVLRAIKYLESKKVFEKQWCIGNLVKGDTYGCGLGGSLGQGNSMKLNNIPCIDESDY